MMQKREFLSARSVAEIHQILAAWNHRGVPCCERKGDAFRLFLGTRKPFQRSAFSFYIEGTVDPTESGARIRYSVRPDWQDILLLGILLLTLLSGLLRLLGGNGSPVLVLVALAMNGLLWLWILGEMRECERLFTDRIGVKNAV